MISDPVEKRACNWPWRFAALFGLLIVACFPQVVAGLKTFFFVDYAQFGYPIAFYHRESFWRGEVPLWNPLNNCGMPFLAQWNTMTLYPLSLFYLLFPLPWSLGVFCLAHIFLAGLGMNLLAYRWTGNRLAAAVAGVAFGFNGLTWYGLMWPNNIAALGWMPWVALAMEKAWRDGGRWLAPAALAGAAQMLSGAPEIILQTWFFLGVLWLARFFHGEIPRTKLAGRALAAGVLVAGLAAAQLLPFFDLLKYSQRDVNFGESTHGIAMQPGGWANYLVPLFHSYRNAFGMRLQFNQGWTGSYYVGVGIIALALLAIWRVRHQRIWLLFAVAVFSLVMALGESGLVYPALQRVVPQLGLMRFPIKFVALATFAIPLLAAEGLAWLQALPPEQWPREWMRFKWLAGGLLGLIAAILCYAWKYPQPTDNFALIVINAVVRATFLIVIVAMIGLVCRRAEIKWRGLLSAGIVLLVWFDVFTHVPNLSPTVDRSAFEPDAIRQYFKWDNRLSPGGSRAMESQASLWKMLSASSGNPELDTLGRRLALFLNLNLLDGVPKLDGFYALDLKEFSDVFKRVYFTTNDTSKLKDFLGISEVNNPTNVVDWISRQSFLPLVTAGQQPIFAEDAAALNAVMSARFDPLHEVYLPPEARAQAHALGKTDARVLSMQFSAQQLQFETQAAGPAMVAVAQTFYHPWHAYVDGKSVPLWRANYAFQALEVPGGNHHVSVVYEDLNFRLGVILALVSLFVCAMIWFFPRGRFRDQIRRTAAN